MKIEQLLKISNPDKVYKKFKKLGLHHLTNIYVSTRKDKKYMVIHPQTHKKIHFGSTMADFTKHQDEKRRNAFLSRNAKWANSDVFTPSYLSYTLLW